MEAILLAGGLGTRLKNVVTDVPKVLAPVGGKPFIEYLLDYLVASGVGRVILSVGFEREKIIQRYSKGYGSLTIAFSEEESPLGTGGAMKLAISQCKENQVFVLNGDSIFLLPLKKILEFHQEKKAKVTLAVRRVDCADRFGTVVFGEKGQVLSFREKVGAKEGYINGGIYCVERAAIFSCLESFGPRFSMEHDFFPQLLKSGIPSFAFPAENYFIDIGLPESYLQANRELPAQIKAYQQSSSSG